MSSAPRDCLSLRMDQDDPNLLSPCRLLLLCCIIDTSELPVGPFSAAVMWHSRTELLTEGCETESDL